MQVGSRIAVLATMLLAFTASDALALYTPNPAARWDPNRFFFAGDLQYNGDKDLDPGDIDDEVGLFLRTSYAFARNAVVYGRLGFQDADHVETGFALGLGAQIAWEIPQAPDWTIGGAFDFLWWDLESNGGSDIDYYEFQLAPAVSYNFPQARWLSPYGGVAIDFLTDDLDEDNPVGLFFGSSFDLTDHVRLDAQFRVIHEEGIGISAGYLF